MLAEVFRDMLAFVVVHKVFAEDDFRMAFYLDKLSEVAEFRISFADTTRGRRCLKYQTHDVGGSFS